MQLYTRILIAAGIGLGSAAAASVGFAQQVLQQEPRTGFLHYGSVFLVDDGTCGKGKIKKIVAGSGALCGGCLRVPRKRTCIPRSEMKPS
jgi:hypothetical protein